MYTQRDRSRHVFKCFYAHALFLLIIWYLPCLVQPVQGPQPLQSSTILTVMDIHRCIGPWFHRPVIQNISVLEVLDEIWANFSVVYRDHCITTSWKIDCVYICLDEETTRLYLWMMCGRLVKAWIFSHWLLVMTTRSRDVVTKAPS